MPEDPVFDKKHSPFETLQQVIKAVATLFFTVVGTMIGCYVGALAYPTPPGVGSFSGAAVGCVLAGIIGCCATDWIWDFLPEADYDMSKRVPDVVAQVVGAQRSFSAIVTIHEVKNVSVSGRMLYSNPELYIMVDCPGNPLKQTGVSKAGVFNEQFKINVSKGTKSVVFLIKDRRLFGAANVGFVSVDVMEDIIYKNFPMKKEFSIGAGEEFVMKAGGPSPQLVMSFEAADNVKWPQTPATGGLVLTKETAENYASPQYGSVQFLSKLSFDQGAKLHFVDKNMKFPNYTTTPVTGYAQWAPEPEEAWRDTEAQKPTETRLGSGRT